MANITGTQTLNGILILELDSNPSLLGVVAPIGSFGSATDGSGFFVKAGALSTDWNEVLQDNTDASTLLFESATMGVIEGGQLTNGGGFNLNIASGYGYYEQFPDVDVTLRKDWVATVLAIAPNSDLYVYFNNSGVLTTNGSQPDTFYNILLGRVVTDGVGIVLVDDSGSEAEHTSNRFGDLFRKALGPVYASGSIATENVTPFHLDVTGGLYYFASNKYAPVGAVNLSFTPTLGGVAQAVINLVPKSYDNAGVLTAIPGIQYAKHSLYVVGQGGNEKYFLVYATATYATLLAVQQAGIPLPPTWITGSVSLISGIIVQQGAANITQIVDERPIPGFRATGVNASADHTSLLNLTSGNAGHTQFMMLDGSTPMAGSLNMGGNSIINTVIALANGGSGQTTANAALNAFLPSQAGNANKFLKTDGTNASWSLETDLGTVTNVSSATAELTVATPTTTPVITIVSAPKFTTARTISGTGEATFTTTAFDGSANVSGAVTLSNAAVIAKLLTGYVSGAGVITAADSILTAIQKLNGNVAGLVTGVSSVFGRTGAVVAVSGDYTTTLVTEGTNLYYTNARVNTQVATYTGDVTLTGTVFSIGALKVTNAMLAGSISLTTKVTGLLPIANGGTNAATANAALNNLLPSQAGNAGKTLQTNGTDTSWVADGGGTVTNFIFTNGAGITGVVTTSTTTPTLSLTLGAITPTSVNGITFSGSGSIANSGVSSLTAFTGSGTSSGTNTGNQTITLTGDVTGSGTGSFAATISALAVTNAKIANATIDLTTKVTGALPNANLANSSVTIGTTNISLGATSLVLAGLTTVTSTSFVGALTGNASTVTTNANLTGDVTSVGNATTLATVNANVGSFTYGSFTVNAKGLITAASSGAAPEVPLTFSTGLTRAVNTITANLSTGIAGGQSVRGGTAASESLTLQSTTNATKGFILSTDNFNIGNAVTTTQRIIRIGQDTAFIDIGSRVGSTANAAIYFNQTAPSSSNFVLQGGTASTTLNGNSTVSSNGVFISISNVMRAQFSDGAITLTPGVTTAGIGPVFSFTSAANTAQTSGSEAIVVDWNLAATIQHAGSTLLALQRGFNITAPTFSYASAGGIITNSPTLNITGAVSGGANTTITNSHGILIQAGAVANVTNAYGITVNAPTGATNNYAGQFIGKVGFNLAAPTAFADVDASVAANASLRIRAGVAPTTPNDSDFWNSSTNKSIDVFIAGITQHLQGTIFTQIANQTSTNVAGDVTMFGTGRTGDTKTLPANFWTIGKTIRVKIYGDMGAVAAATSTLKMKLGATTVLTSSVGVALPTLTNPQYFEVEMILTCRTTGATGTVTGAGRMIIHDATVTADLIQIVRTTTTIDTTASQALDATFAFTVASATNTITTSNATIEILN